MRGIRDNFGKILIMVFLVIFILLLGPCGHGYNYGLKKYHAWRPTSQSIPPALAPDLTSQKLDQILANQKKCCHEEPQITVPDGCTVDRTTNPWKVICPPCKVCEECKATPPPPRKTCAALAQKTGQPWQCRAPSTSYKEAQAGLCQGQLLCMIPNGEAVPPPSPPPLRPPMPGQSKQGCVDHPLSSNVLVVELYSPVLSHEGVKVSMPEARIAGNRAYFSPTRTLRICIPLEDTLGYYNLKAAPSAGGHWAVGTEGSQLQGNREVNTPNFDIYADGVRCDSDHAVKVGNDWTCVALDARRPIEHRSPSSGGDDSFQVE